MKLRLAGPAVVLLALLAVIVTLSGQRQTVTAADYARAEKLLAPNLAGFVVGGAVAPNRLPDDRFWYRSTGVMMIDPVKKSQTRYADCPAEGGVPEQDAAVGLLREVAPRDRPPEGIPDQVVLSAG
jgi:hypothetical protein